MRKYLLFIVLSLLSVVGLTQQDAQFTQFMYNKLNYNPAYAGSIDATLATAIFRSQWLGLEGAPRSQIINFESALSERVGLGLNLSRYSIGISNNYNVDLAYAYRFPVGKGRLGVGLQGSIRSFNANYSDERLQATDGLSIDSSIPDVAQNKLTPNFGAGVYYKEERLYIGFSVPRLLENNIDFSEDATVISTSIRHFYLMGGYVFDLNEKVQMQPQVLFKYAENSPFDMDANLTFIFMEKYAVGASYRVGGSTRGIPAESIDLLFNFQINEKLLFGIAYDVTVSELRDHASGSIEAMIRYNFKGGTTKEEESESNYLNPRFF